MEKALPIGDLKIKEEQIVVEVGILHQVIGNTLFRSVALDIENAHTEVIMADYADRFMLVISQCPQLGTMFLVKRNFVNDLQGKQAVYSTRVVFGDAGEEQYVAARYIGEIIPIDKPVILFLNLHCYKGRMIKALKTFLDALIYHEYYKAHDKIEYRDYDPENPCGVDLRTRCTNNVCGARNDEYNKENDNPNDEQKF